MGVDDQAAAQDRCECGADPGDINFDRSICACGSMHYFCNQCGTQAEPCSDESPAASSGDDVTLGDIEEHEMWEEHTRERVEQMREASSAAQIHQRLLRARRVTLHALILALGVPKQHRHAAYIALRKALRYAR